MTPSVLTVHSGVLYISSLTNYNGNLIKCLVYVVSID